MKAKVRYWLYRALVYPLALLPFWALYLLSDMLYLLFAKVFHYRRKVIEDNLRSSFPEKSPEELAEVKKEFYRHFCDNIVETIKLMHISDKTLLKRIEVVNADYIDKVAAEGHPIVMFLGHYGNWEWVPAVSMHYSPEIHSGHIYKRLHDSAADRLMHEVRARFNSEGIEQNLAVRRLIQLKQEKRPFIVGFISDHRSNSKLAHQRVEFLNHITPYNTGGETIGEKIGAKYIYLDVEKTGRGKMRLTVVPIDPVDDGEPFPAMRRYMQLLEATIRRQPSYWLWSHRRWLYH